MKRLFMSLVPMLLAAGASQAASLPAVSVTPVHANMEIESGYRSNEVFRHFTSECAGGRVFFLGTLKYGRFWRLTLLSAPDAAAYIETDGEGKYPWLLACDGKDKFLVEKEYGTGEARFRFYKGRALEGIDYVEGRHVSEIPVHAAIDHEAFAEKMASELARHRMDFIATNQGTRFEGRLESRTGSCDMVAIKRSSGADESTTRFKICSGRVCTLSGQVAMNASR